MSTDVSTPPAPVQVSLSTAQQSLSESMPLTDRPQRAYPLQSGNLRTEVGLDGGQNSPRRSPSDHLSGEADGVGDPGSPRRHAAHAPTDHRAVHGAHRAAAPRGS